MTRGILGSQREVPAVMREVPAVMREQDILIITGGSIDAKFAREYLSHNEFGHIIAVDRGLETADALGLTPEYLVGDFDTVNPGILEKYRNRSEVRIREYCPEKDDTDTQIAVLTALSAGSGDIVMLGATGTRFDHTLANLFLMEEALTKGRHCCMVDEKNRIWLADRSFLLPKKEAWGDYLSLIPLTDIVRPVTLRGVKYPLDGYTMKRIKGGLGVSNEITGETAEVSFDEGILIVVEAKD